MVMVVFFLRTINHRTFMQAVYSQELSSGLYSALDKESK